MRQLYGIAARERAQRLGQVCQLRHLGVVDQHRDHALLLRERRLDLKPHEVLWVIEPTPPGVVGCGEPAPPDHRDQHVAFRHLLVHHLDEVEAGRDVVNIHEQLVGGECLLQPAEQRLGETRIIAPPIIDEDVSGHYSAPPCLPAT